MRVLFILPCQNDGLEPLGVLQLAAALRAAGHDVRATVPVRRSIARLFQTFQPQVIAYSVITGWHKETLALNAWVKHTLSPKVFSFFGGPHPTFYPAMALQAGVDAICRGEGEEAFVDLVGRLTRGEDWFQTPNWCVAGDGAARCNPIRPLIANLDELPFADRSLLVDCRSYINPRLRSFIATRGCAFSCSYCFNHAYRELYEDDPLRGRIRHRTVSNLLDEICDVRARYGMRHVAFFDDIFPTGEAWLDEFMREYGRRVGLPFECNLRVEQVSPRVVAALRQAGCAIAALGLETANEEMRQIVLRRQYSNEQISRACALIREHGILLKTYNILGLPTSNLAAEWKTVRLNRALAVDLPTASLFQPYPGTDLGEAAATAGCWSGDVDDLGPGFYRRSSLNLPEAREIEILQKLFLPAVRMTWLAPVLRWFTHRAANRLVYKVVIAADQLISRTALALGKRLPVAEDLRRVALRLMGEPRRGRTLRIEKVKV
jgi:radical SAM superfamily enzyme YgiQ (UPF0313 family)